MEYIYIHASSAFPVNNSGSTNYWADVVFAVPDLTPPTISSVSPVNGAMNISTGATVSAVFNEALNPSTVTSSTFELRNASGTLIPATVNYTPGTSHCNINSIFCT